MTPYWARWTGFGSMLAPTSMRTIGPANVGTVTAMPGRMTFGRRRMYIWLAVTQAPVFPAEIQASQRFGCFGLAYSAAREIELSRFERTASTGGSSISMTSEQWTTSIFAPGPVLEIPRSLMASSIRSPCPNRTSVSSGGSFASAANEPLRISSGALSPPMMSTPIRIACCPRDERGLGTERVVYDIRTARAPCGDHACSRATDRARGAETKTPASSAGAIMLFNQAAGPLPVLICRPGRT